MSMSMFRPTPVYESSGAFLNNTDIQMNFVPRMAQQELMVHHEPRVPELITTKHAELKKEYQTLLEKATSLRQVYEQVKQEYT